MTNAELIALAERCLRPHTTDTGRLIGDVSAVVVSGSGGVFSGVCVDTPGWGLCAERAALAAMVTAGEYVIATVVAVWRDVRDGKLYVLPPCGICREFMRQLSSANLDATVILGRETVTTLSELLPSHAWPAPLEGL